ncbi:MAG: hypothetical protein KKE05_07110, partial [Nanoarchaeota archaeon]|nr:hypothetical protein [Nanoarchaeota archaeon]
LNYFVKGIVRGLSSSPLGKPITITDYCWKDKFPNSTYGERLREMSCLPDNHIAQEDYECDVCLDGACVE